MAVRSRKSGSTRPGTAPTCAPSQWATGWSSQAPTEPCTASTRRPARRSWATQVVNPVGGGGIDVSPVYYKGLVIIGTTGGDWGGSCIAVALDAKTGKVKWHYSLIPSNPKAFGWNTWPVNRYYYGGAAVWDEPAVDPTTGNALFGVGQPLPFNGLINGPGAEMGTDGVYALDAMTGKFKWFYQEVHHDIWDYDGMQTPKVLPLTINGKKQDVVVHINKSAYYFVLDTKTGRPLHPTPEVPVPQNARAHTFPTQPIPQTGADELVPRLTPYPQDYQGVIAPDGKPYLIPTPTVHAVYGRAVRRVLTDCDQRRVVAERRVRPEHRLRGHLHEHRDLRPRGSAGGRPAPGDQQRHGHHPVALDDGSELDLDLPPPALSTRRPTSRLEERRGDDRRARERGTRR